MGVDGLDLRADGTVVVRLCGGEWRLRRPLLGELRGWRENEPCDDMERAVWLVGVLSVLNVQNVPPDPDGLPAWAADPSVYADLVNHWRHVPAGPWQPSPGQVPAQGGRPGWVGEFGPVYRALAERNVTPSEADRLEVWQVAAVLDLLDRDSTADGRDLIAERVAARRSGGPPPVARPSGAGLANLLSAPTAGRR